MNEEDPVATVREIYEWLNVQQFLDSFLKWYVYDTKDKSPLVLDFEKIMFEGLLIRGNGNEDECTMEMYCNRCCEISSEIKFSGFDNEEAYQAFIKNLRTRLTQQWLCHLGMVEAKEMDEVIQVQRRHMCKGNRKNL